MTKTLLNEGLKYMDMEHQIVPIVSIDQYESSIGTNDDLITMDFIVKGKAVGEDLSEWFEKGYDWVLDSEVSPGEVKSGEFLVFVEMSRRNASPKRIVEMLDDLQTLTGFKLDDWTVRIKDEEIKPDVDAIKQRLETSPHEYREVHPDEDGDDTLNEWKQIAGVNMKTTPVKDSEAIQRIKRQAGIY